MTKEQELQDYPELIDPFLDFEATREFMGRGSCVYGISHYKNGSGKVVVYMGQQREGDEVVCLGDGQFGRKCIHGLIVAGYLARPKGLLSMFKGKKIRIIPNEDRENVESELLERVTQFGKKPDYVDFW